MVEAQNPKMKVSRPRGAQELTIHFGQTAVLIMDYQNDIVSMMPEQARKPLLDKAHSILRRAREAHVQVIYVVVRFRTGYPEVSAQNKRFSVIRESGRLREGSLGAEIHTRIAPQPGDIVVTKRRTGAFSTTDLESILRAKRITTLLMFGISTSGCVLSTVRWAADMDYQIIVASDACADIDDEVHRILMGKVLPAQATIATSQVLVRAIRANRE